MRKILLAAALLVSFASNVLAQPLNDNCLNATPIIIPGSGSICVNGSTLTATTTTWLTPTCGQTNWTNDVWFTFVSNGSLNTITVRPFGAPPATTLGISVFTGGCGALTGLGTYCGIAPAPNDSVQIVQAGTAGTQYWIEISSFGTAGNFQLCINSSTPPPSPGTTCATATQVCDLTSFTLATGPAGTGVFTPNCFDFPAVSSVWYQFSVGTNGSLVWNCDPGLAGTELDWAVFNITNGCGAANLNANTVACNYNYGNQGSNPIGMNAGAIFPCPTPTNTANGAPGEFCLPINVVAGQTYAIMIDNFSNNSSGWNFNWTGSTFGMAPTSAFTLNTNKICGNSGSVNITNSSVGATSWNWNFGDGATSNAQNPGSHNFTAPGTYIISLTATSATGCTDVSTQSIQIIANPILTTVSDTICTGQPATLTVTPDVGGGTYLWNPGAFNTQTITVTPAINTTYTVTYTSPDNCTASATAAVTIQTATFTVNAGIDSTICANQTLQLNGSVNPNGAYTYSWSPSGSLTNPTTLTPFATPPFTTAYVLSVTDANGCTKTDTVAITVMGVGVPIQASANPATICPGQLVQLDYTALPISCGPNLYGCGGFNATDSLGTGYNVQCCNSTTNIAVYGNFLKSTRMQIIYPASEIATVFGGAGTIKALAWEVGVFNSNATLQNFTIQMGCVSPAQTTLSNWVTGLQTVYGPTNYTPIAGWNNHNLSTLYDWDGGSNLVIEICFYSANTFGNQNNMMVYTNVANSVLYSRGNTDQCTIVNPPTSSNERPKLRMRFCTPDYSLFTVNWTPSSGPNTVSNPVIKSPTTNPWTSQNYQVNVTYNGCVGSDIVTVSIDTSAKVDAGPDKTFCAGVPVNMSATGTGNLVPPNLAFTYQWKQLPAGNVISNSQNFVANPVATTTYVVTMLGGYCPAYDTITLFLGSLPFTHTVTQINCNGAANGKIKLTPNGTAPYTFQWSANALTGNVDSAMNLAPGVYYATITDNVGCVAKDTVTITQPTAVSFTNVVRNVSCNGGSDGKIVLNVSGGTPGYTFVWSTTATTPDSLTGLAIGNYTVTVRDVNLCSASGTFNVTQPTAISYTSQQKDIRCFNGSDGFITITPSGGTGPYTYDWNPNTTFHQNNPTALTAGTYDVTVYDANNCTLTATFTLIQPATGLVMNTTSFTPVTCFGGSDGTATAVPVGGATPYTYAWNPSGQTSATAIGLSAQTYTVVVTDDSLCTASGTINVPEPPQIQITGNVTNVLCNGGSSGIINITITNGVPPFSPVWSNGATTQNISGIPQGSYTVTITDNTNCTGAATFNVTQPPALILNPPIIQNVSCFGGNDGSVFANPSGGTQPYTYAWTPSGNTQQISSLIAANYVVTVTDNNGCTISNVYQVTEPATAVTFGAANVTNLLCNGASNGSVTVNVSGGTGAYTYTWSHNASLNNSTVINLPAGNYSVTATDANGCTASSSYAITQPTAIQVSIQSQTNVSCFGYSDGEATLSVSGGTGAFTYTWNGNAGGNPQGNLVANNYNVVVTDANGCTAGLVVTITESAPIVLSPIVTNVKCFSGSDGSVDANPSGGTQPYSFAWSNNLGTTQVVSGLIAASYSVTVTDANNCSISAASLVTEPSFLTVGATSTQVTCSGSIDGTVTAFGNGGTVPYFFELLANNVVIQSNNSGSFLGLQSGNYTVKITDANNCPNTTAVVIPAPVPDFFAHTVDSTSCYGAAYDDGAIHIQGLTVQNQPYQFSVDGGGFSFSGDFYNLSSGNHIITAKNNWGCITTIPIIIPEPAEGIADILPGDTIIELGQVLHLSSTFSPYPASSITSYLWSPSTGLSCIDCPNPVLTSYAHETTYSLLITYNGNCKAIASMTVIVTNHLKTFIPNAFSPNGDGNNDVFMIYGDGIKTVDLKIFNRWGEKVFDSNNQFLGWDGTYKGVIQNPAVFSYSISITYLDDTKVQRVGSVTILR